MCENCSGKRRGFALKAFEVGEFICEYKGELINAQKARQREIEYEEDLQDLHALFRILFALCIDATAESDRLARLLNHSKKKSNVSPRLYPIDGVPHIIF